MWVLYVSFGSKVRTRSCFVWISCEIVLFCPGITLCRYGCIYFLAPLVTVCVDVMLMSSA